MRTLAITAVLAVTLATTAGRAHAQATDVKITNFTNDPALVQPQADSLPFVYTMNGNFPDAGNKEFVFSGITPVGYYFIIDHISVFASLPAGTRAWATTKAYDPTKPASPQGFVALPLAWQGTSSNSDIFIGNPSVSMFLPNAWNLRVTVIRNEGGGGGFAYVTLQGHLARIPSISRQ